MEVMGQNEPYSFRVVFGFTDSTFFKDVGTDTKARDFTQTCKDKLGVTVELKNVFTNSIFYGKKNRFVAWTGNDTDEPIIKGLDGLSDSNPKWVRKWFKRIVIEIVKHPETRLESIPLLIKEAFTATFLLLYSYLFLLMHPLKLTVLRDNHVKEISLTLELRPGLSKYQDVNVKRC